MVSIIAPSRYLVDKKSLKRIAQDFALSRQIRGEINIVFVGSRKMKQLSETYMADTLLHPVLTFDYSKDKIGPRAEQNISGEIVICYPQAVLLAAEKNRQVKVIIEELVQHGLNSLASAR